MPISNKGSFALEIICVAITMFILLHLLIAALRHHPSTGIIGRLTPLALVSLTLWCALFAWAALHRKDNGVITIYLKGLRARKQLPILIGIGIAILAINLSAVVRS